MSAIAHAWSLVHQLKILGMVVKGVFVQEIIHPLLTVYCNTVRPRLSEPLWPSSKITLFR